MSLIAYCWKDFAEGKLALRPMQYRDVKKAFGMAVKTWRGASGISQEELAWRAGLHRSYLADIERGARNASLRSIEKLAKALQIPLSTLFEPLDRNGGSRGLPSIEPEILLVEDDPRDRDLTLEAFRRARLTNTVHLAKDGAEALDFVFRRGPFATRTLPNESLLILLDLNLPKVPGMEVLREIRRAEETQDIRVIVLTISDRDDHIQEALDLGAEAYIQKPVNLMNLIEKTPELDFSWTMQGKRRVEAVVQP